jgi:arylsulfatase A-like enzyme
MDQPNILFILLDDMGWRDLTCYGSTFYETPNIDRLAKEGLLFTDAYASCPVCSPTRASVITGKYPARVDLTNYIAGKSSGLLQCPKYTEALPTTHTSVATALKDGGYQTWHVGKWHLGGEGHEPEQFGFEVNVGGCSWGAPGKGYFYPWHMPAPGMEDGKEGDYLTDYLTTKAIELIDQRDADKPFFMNFCHYAVHTPIQAPADLIAKYEQKARDLGLDKMQTVIKCEKFPSLQGRGGHVKRRIIQSHAAYAAMIENLDQNIGRLLDALAAAGIAENTAVFFTSDNGGLATSEGSPTSNYPLSEGKGWMYDGGVREPLLVRWPKRIEAGTTTDAITTSTDFFPTFLEMAGLPLRPDDHVDGMSILPALEGDAKFDRGAIYWHYPHYSNQGGTPGCSIRRGEWKLIEFFETGGLELYNLKEDIGEHHNLAKKHPELTAELHQMLVEWREEVDATIPQVDPDYVDKLRGLKPIAAMH